MMAYVCLRFGIPEQFEVVVFLVPDLTGNNRSKTLLLCRNSQCNKTTLRVHASKGSLSYVCCSTKIR